MCCILAKEYQIQFDEKMMIRAIKTRQMKFLRMIWVTNKNKELVDMLEDSEEDAESEEFSVDDDQRKTFMYDDLIRNIMKYGGDEVDDRLNELA